MENIVGGLAIVLIAFACAETAENDCYTQEKGGKLVIGNSKIEIRLDAATGAVVGLYNKQAAVEYLRKGTQEVLKLVHCTYSLNGDKSGDIWSAAYGTLVNSSQQKVGSKKFVKTNEGAKLEVSCDPASIVCSKAKWKTLAGG